MQCRLLTSQTGGLDISNDIVVLFNTLTVWLCQCSLVICIIDINNVTESIEFTCVMNIMNAVRATGQVSQVYLEELIRVTHCWVCWASFTSLIIIYFCAETSCINHFWCFLLFEACTSRAWRIDACTASKLVLHSHSEVRQLSVDNGFHRLISLI